MGLRLITAATVYPVTLDQAKARCRVDGNDDDADINSLIAAATDYVEQYTGRALMVQTWELVLDEFADSILIPKGPTTSITSVKYYDENGNLQTISSANYALDAVSNPQWLVRATDYTWPTVAEGVNNVVIRFQCGSAEAPASINHAILLLIGQWFDNRAAVNVGNIATAMPHAVESLLSNYRSFLN